MAAANVLFSPNTAGRSERVDEQMVTLFIENLRRCLAGAELLNADPPTGTADSQ